MLSSPLRIKLVSDIDGRYLKLVLYVDAAFGELGLRVGAIDTCASWTACRRIASPVREIGHIVHVVVDARPRWAVIRLRAIVSRL